MVGAFMRRRMQRPAGGDPHFASVQLLLHMNGTNGSATFTDNSANAYTPTVSGAVLTTTSPKYGTAAGSFNGSANLAYANVANLQLGTGDFTIECWVNTSADGTFASKGNPGTNGFAFRIASGVLEWQSFAGTLTGSGGPAASTWTHCAVTRSSTTVTLWLGGTSVGSATDSATISGGTSTLVVGNSINGKLDDFRFTKGFARYTGTFTPPASPFPDS